MKRSIDSGLPAELRDELARSRRAGHDYDVLAKLPALRAALAAPPPHGADPSSDAGPEADANPFTRAHLAPPAWKLGLLIATLGVTAFVAWPLLHHQQVAPEHAPVSAPRAAATALIPEPSKATPEAQPEPQPKALANEPAAAQPAPSAQEPVRSSRREIAQLIRIRALLARDPAAAYRLAQQSEREFPNGVLSEERQALQVLALAKSGSTDAARTKARAFFARYPQSPMRELLDAALPR